MVYLIEIEFMKIRNASAVPSRRHRSILLAASLAWVVDASPQSTPQSNEELKKRIDELDQQVRILQRQLELDKDASTETGKRAPVVSAGANGFTIRSADTNFVLKLRGYVQADARFFPNDNASGSVNDAFLMRRVRPIIEGTVFENFDYRLMLDFGSGLTSSGSNVGFTQDACVTARLWPEFQIQAGKFKEPVGLERLQSGASILFVERGYPTQIAPNRDVGVQLQGEIGGGLFSYAAGIFNGVADGGSGDIETSDDEKDFAGRIFSHPFKNSNDRALQGLGIGVSGTFGNQEGALRNYVTPGQQRFFSYRTGAGTNAAAANVVANGDHWRISPQAYYYLGPFGLLGEYIISEHTVGRTAGGPATVVSLRNTAWQIAASYILTGEDNSFKPLVPRNPFTIGNPGWGAWEAKARVGKLRIDDNTFPLYANPATSARSAFSWAVGLNWHLNKNIKLQLDYEQTEFDDGALNPFTANGEKAVLTRAQFSF